MLSNKILPRRMYVIDEPKHLVKSFQQGTSQTKLLKLPVSHHDECVSPTKKNNWQKKKKKGVQSTSIWQSKHITDASIWQSKAITRENNLTIWQAQAFGKAKQAFGKAITRENNLTITFTSKSPLNIGRHALFSK